MANLSALFLLLTHLLFISLCSTAAKQLQLSSWFICFRLFFVLIAVLSHGAVIYRTTESASSLKVCVISIARKESQSVIFLPDFTKLNLLACITCNLIYCNFKERKLTLGSSFFVCEIVSLTVVITKDSLLLNSFNNFFRFIF